jgi:hypothetical protein
MFSLFLCLLLYLISSFHAIKNTDELQLLLSKNAVSFPKLQISNNHPIVIVTAVNHGFLPHLYNFNCFLKLLDLPYLVLSLDFLTHQTLQSQHNATIHSYYLQLPGETDVSLNASEFRTKDFNIITARKILGVEEILKRSFDVLFLDVDVILLQNPFPFLLWDYVHYVHSLNYPCDST